MRLKSPPVSVEHISCSQLSNFYSYHGQGWDCFSFTVVAAGPSPDSGVRLVPRVPRNSSHRDGASNPGCSWAPTDITKRS